MENFLTDRNGETGIGAEMLIQLIKHPSPSVGWQELRLISHVARAAFLLHHRVGHGRHALELVARGRTSRQEEQSDEGTDQRADYCAVINVMKSPFSTAVHSRFSTSLQFRRNHFSTSSALV